MAKPSPKLPSLKEFFLAHGEMTRAPRTVLPYHDRIFRAITQWMTGTLPDGKRHLVVCMPPRHSKTFIARDAVAWGLVCFPDSEWIYTSYSTKLAVAQTVAIKDCCASDWYREMAPFVGIRRDKGRQEYFKTSRGGSVYGVGVGGTITGFGAGKKRPEFGGGIIVDDPLSADDALSVAKREGCNEWYSKVLYSRRNATHTPMMFIMQRLHMMDLVGYVLSQEPELWHVLSIPAMDKNGEMLWPETFDKKTAELLEKMDPFTFASQYQQSPTPAGGAMIKEGQIQRYSVLPDLVSYGVFADTAQKTGQHNDYSVLICAGTDGQNVYIVDIWRDKVESPDLLQASKDFWEVHKPHRILRPARFEGFFIEDKSSGTGLIQQLQRDTSIPVIPVPRNRDKVSRVNDILPYVRSGRLFVPEFAPWVSDYESELLSFSPAMTHLHDDQVDPTCDAISILLSAGGGLVNNGDWS
ncbi:MAG: phage terminase large subunit [Pseudomonadota bacterium]